MQELEQENKDMDKCVEEFVSQKTNDNFRLSANRTVPNTHTNRLSLFEH